jgi:hypothetical protein
MVFSQCVADSRVLPPDLRRSPCYQKLFKLWIYRLTLLASQLRYVTLRLLIKDAVGLEAI